MKKWNDLTKKVKIGLVSGAAIIVVAGGFGVSKVHAENMYQDQKADLTKKLAAISDDGSLANKIEALTDKNGFIKTSVTPDVITKLEVALSELSDDTKEFVSIRNEKIKLDNLQGLQNQLKVIEQKISIENLIKSSLSEKYDGWISESNPKTFVLAEKATTDSLKKITNELSELTSSDDAWQKKVDSIINQAQNQFEKLDNATKLVNGFFSDGKLKSKEIKKADYDAAVKATNDLERKSDKDALNKKLKTVKGAYDKQVKEKAKKLAEEKAKAEKEAAEKAEAAKKEAEAQAEKEAADQANAEVVQNEAEVQASQEEQSVEETNDAVVPSYDESGSNASSTSNQEAVTGSNNEASSSQGASSDNSSRQTQTQNETPVQESPETPKEETPQNNGGNQFGDTDGDGHMTQEELDNSERENFDPHDDPNSPWAK